MTAIQKEADDIISMMRRSKMDDIRKYLEMCIRKADKGSYAHKNFLGDLKGMFTTTSNNAPLP